MANATTFSNIFGVRYGIGKQIGEGSFGTVFEGTNLLNQQQVAIKFEPCKTTAPQLRNEYRTYKALFGCPGIPNAYHLSREGSHNMLIIDLLGPSLEDLFDRCNRRFTIKTVVMVGKQMLSRIQTVHERNIIHRDIKPENFLVGRLGTGNANTIHIVDFGMAKQYRDPTTKQHISYKEHKSLTGTIRYMSINTHFRREQSRRDDLEALGHVIMYFLRGDLPWQGLKATANEQKYDKIGRMKQAIPVEEVCYGFPREFNTYLSYVRNLGFEDTPDYEYLRGLLSQALVRAGGIEDGEYDWMKPSGQTSSKVTGVNSVVPQMHRSNAHQNPPPAVIFHEQYDIAHSPTEYHRWVEPITNHTTQSVPRSNVHLAAMCQAHLRYNQSSVCRNGYRPTHSYNQYPQLLQQKREPEAVELMQKFADMFCCSRSRR